MILIENASRDELYQWTCDRCRSLIVALGEEGRKMHEYRDGPSITFECACCGEPKTFQLSE